MGRQAELERGTASGHDAGEARSVMLQLSGVLDSLPHPAMDRWTAELRRGTGTAVAAFSLVDDSRVFVKSISTADGSAARPAVWLPSESLESYLHGLVDPDHSPVLGGAYAQAPVWVDDQMLGLVSIADRAPRDWADEDLQALDRAAAELSTELALRLAQKRVEHMQQLVASHNTVHDMIARAAPIHDVLLEVTKSIERHDPSVMASVLLLDPASSTLHSGVGPSLPPEYLASIDGVVIGPNVGTCGSAAWSGQLTITVDIAEDPKWAPIRDQASEAGLRHCWSMPIKTSHDEVLGTLAFYGPRPRHPLPEHLTLLQDWARVAGIAIERHRTLERLVHDARHDSLTGLPNRMAIFEALDEVLQRATPDAQTAVLFVDLDGLKTLNDTYGHDRADEMIREMADRLSMAVRSNEFVGRIGGDEFVVIAEGVGNAEEAAHAGLRLLDVISRPMPGIDPIVVTASIGIALVGSSAIDAREAIRESDSAMYAAKRSGGDRCAFFEGDQRVRTGRRLLLERELHGAEKRGELRLVFQPVFGLEAAEIVGVEALLRWNNPTAGQVSPVEFIPVADDSGAIVPIGAWVLRESCETIARLSADLGRSIELAVNVSARQLANPEFSLWVRQTLAHAEFPTELLSLEITETALMRPNAVTTRNLRELTSLGVRIVLDDFGTGFSSLSWLKEHPFGEIKIDQSFISGLPEDGRDRAIVAAVIGMAKGLGCRVTAEGVETEQQLAALLRLDCERGQGFLLARPMPAEELFTLLRRGSPVSIG